MRADVAEQAPRASPVCQDATGPPPTWPHGPRPAGDPQTPPAFFSHSGTGVDQAQAAVGENYYMIASMRLVDRGTPDEFHLDGVATPTGTPAAPS